MKNKLLITLLFSHLVWGCSPANDGSSGGGGVNSGNQDALTQDGNNYSGQVIQCPLTSFFLQVPETQSDENWKGLSSNLSSEQVSQLTLKKVIAVVVPQTSAEPSLLEAAPIEPIAPDSSSIPNADTSLQPENQGTPIPEFPTSVSPPNAMDSIPATDGLAPINFQFICEYNSETVAQPESQESPRVLAHASYHKIVTLPHSVLIKAANANENQIKVVKDGKIIFQSDRVDLGSGLEYPKYFCTISEQKTCEIPNGLPSTTDHGDGQMVTDHQGSVNTGEGAGSVSQGGGAGQGSVPSGGASEGESGADQVPAPPNSDNPVVRAFKEYVVEPLVAYVLTPLKNYFSPETEEPATTQQSGAIPAPVEKNYVFKKVLYDKVETSWQKFSWFYTEIGTNRRVAYFYILDKSDSNNIDIKLYLKSGVTWTNAWGYGANDWGCSTIVYEGTLPRGGFQSVVLNRQSNPSYSTTYSQLIAKWDKYQNDSQISISGSYANETFTLDGLKANYSNDLSGKMQIVPVTLNNLNDTSCKDPNLIGLP